MCDGLSVDAFYAQWRVAVAGVVHGLGVPDEQRLGEWARKRVDVRRWMDTPRTALLGEKRLDRRVVRVAVAVGACNGYPRCAQ